MHVNLERGGVLSDTMKRIAVHGERMDVEDRDLDEHIRYALAMSRTDGDSDFEKYERLKAAEGIGRIAHGLRIADNGRVSTKLSFIGEAVGVMPPYELNSDAAIIGRVTIYARHLHGIDVESERQLHRLIDMPLSEATYMADILTSGQVVLSHLHKEKCSVCPDVDDSAEAELLDTLGVADIELSPPPRDLRHIYLGRHALYSFGKHLLDDHQVCSLQAYIKDSFPLPSDE